MSDQGDQTESPVPDSDGAPMRDLPGLAAFAAMGSTAAILIAVGVVLGIWFDTSFGTAPGGLIIGIVLGTVAAVVSVVKQVRRFL